jgi:hypothetical protein
MACAQPGNVLGAEGHGQEDREVREAMSSFRRLGPGDRAPGFTLAAVNRDGVLSLEDFADKRPVLLGLFRGLH